MNGDAELVYAFEALDGRGKVLAHGGLDQEAVTKAILDIMEGTEKHSVAGERNIILRSYD